MASLRKKHLEHFACGIFVRGIANVLYLTGISILLPLILVVLSLPPVGALLFLFLTSILAIGMSMSGAILLRWWKGSWRNTFIWLGIITIAPGIAGLALITSGKDIIGWLVDETAAHRALSLYIQLLGQEIPTVWLVAAVYVILGVVFLHLGMTAPKRTRS